jgi:pimeloyl-ACP methyl ester carboxylesterase
MLKSAAPAIKTNTVIFQGSEDPIFSSEHGLSLHDAIENSEYYYLEGHGHVPNPYFFDNIIDILVGNASNSDH